MPILHLLHHYQLLLLDSMTVAAFILHEYLDHSNTNLCVWFISCLSFEVDYDSCIVRHSIAYYENCCMYVRILAIQVTV